MNFISKEFNELTTKQLYEILKSRAEIFLLEQKIICQDMDDVDYISRHFFLEEKGRVIAYLRAFYKMQEANTIQIGRVLSLRHNKGFGTYLMEKTIEYIKENLNCQKISLNSQKTAIAFYEKFGFETMSEEFLEEGIPHVSMELKL